jgi:hypothetical protein
MLSVSVPPTRTLNKITLFKTHSLYQGWQRNCSCRFPLGLNNPVLSCTCFRQQVVLNCNLESTFFPNQIKALVVLRICRTNIRIGTSNFV